MACKISRLLEMFFVLSLTVILDIFASVFNDATKRVGASKTVAVKLVNLPVKNLLY